jgi:hypothetical protein
MPNMIDYLEWYGDLSFKEVPFNEVDGLILAQLSYIDLAGTVPAVEDGGYITVADAAEKFRVLHDKKEIYARPGVVSPLTAFLLQHMAQGRRYKTARLSNFIEKFDKDTAEQFAALHITLPDKSVYVSFRGTDDTLVGWQEDFDMTFSIVPSQTDAVEYVNRTCRRGRGALRIGGHSKGANLAVYAASLCLPRIARRIVAVYDMDGPGFDPAILPETTFAGIRDRVHTYVPEYDVVGQLLSRTKPTKIVKSDEHGVYEHSAISWQVKGPAFIQANTFDPESVALSKTLNTWISSISQADRKEISKQLFESLADAGATTLSDLMTPNAELYTKILAQVAREPEPCRDDVTKLVTEVASTILSQKTTQTVEAAVAGAKKIFDPVVAKPDPDTPLSEKELWSYRRQQTARTNMEAAATLFGHTRKQQAATLLVLVGVAATVAVAAGAIARRGALKGNA